ncbi:pilus assembly protein [Pseudoalteromonas denitrificans]|uniref:Type IV pilus assembly protein PilY1 n=1 Tax=Pseudoalteromonas denitrificans DSM 6059 TaxID=1123010 RepID=A0A1I1QRP9_9GAMM|nr:PilC/PilY family type IV pilus protein [Pseudoalteromonas denitrificans]SFD24791.1 type IV pilus assembly protein PilY1 [Pseudoalteromonas denitrificans DSM 6059]
MNWGRCLTLVVALLLAEISHSEDIELYVGDTKIQSGTKPQVLIIFDNSGSMGTAITTVEDYKPGTTYPVVSNFDNSLNEDFVYFTIGTGVDNELPRTDKNSDTKRFNSPVNGCDAARVALERYGVYSGFIKEHQYKGNTGSWVELQENSGASTIAALDCLDDVIDKEGTNTNLEIKISGTTYTSAADAILQGLPVNGATKNAKNFYTGSTNVGGLSDTEYQAALDVFDGGQVITLYHPNYLRWYHAVNKVYVDSTRLAVAKTAMTSVINTTPIVDFGLMIFNLDYKGENKRDGGRIISAFGETRADVVTTINNIEAETNTPLCETLYEASRFFSGNSVLYADDDSNCSKNSCGFSYTGNTPAYETSIMSGGSYISPFKEGCASNAYVILITDGAPTRDLAADDEIAALIATKTDPKNEDTSQTPFSDPSLSNTNYLPNLAHWMNHNDVNLNVKGTQSVSLYTIGFSEGADDAAPLLKAAAENGGGTYYSASDALALSGALTTALNEILQINTTFTSPSVASNNFDRTRSLDSVYYAMFFPEEGARWAGNLKKLKVNGDEIVDKNGDPAIDSVGNISDSASTFWLKAEDNDGKPDGNVVKAGGAGAQLAKQASRVVYTDVGSGSPMPSFTKTNALTQVADDAALAAYMATTEAELDNLFSWSKGIDIDDEDGDLNRTELRQDILGDPLHSKPLAINYGDGDVRVLMGTNAGSVHLFKDTGDDISEEWGFIPYELYSNLASLRDNTAGVKVYGMDGSPVIYFDDKNDDGKVETGDTVWAFIGMRRGGNSFYAFDLSSPDKPQLLWSTPLSSSDLGFSEMGQSWSRPKVVFADIDGYKNRPLLIFGAGYDTNKDATIKSDDSGGRGIFIVDAQTKALVWSVTPAVTGGRNTQFKSASGDIIVDSIPGDINTMDSDFDGNIDRLYASDTGGNLWRVDMPGSDPFSSDTPWTVIKLAQLGSNVEADDRRFFYQPEVARTFFSKVTETTVTDENGESTTALTRKETPYEAVLVGSGNRSHPTYTTTNDVLFMIRDENTITKSFNKTADVPSVVTISDLMDITNDPFSGVLDNEDGFRELEVDLAQYHGWKYGLSTSEKSLSEATVVGGIAYFTSFSPSVDNDLANCVLDGGGGLLYAFHLHYGAKVYDNLTLEVGNRVPDSPQLFFGENDEGESQFILIGVGAGEDKTGEGGGDSYSSGVVKLISASDDPVPKPCSDGKISLTGCGQGGTNFMGFTTHRTYIYKKETGSGN